MTRLSPYGRTTPSPPIIRRLAVPKFPENRENNREFENLRLFQVLLLISLIITITKFIIIWPSEVLSTLSCFWRQDESMK